MNFLLVSVALVLFWISIAFLTFTYVGYPLFLAALRWRKPRTVRKEPLLLKVSFVISAHNELWHIGRKLKSILAQEYPEELVEVIVVSDASTDGTEAEVQELGSDKVKLIERKDRIGKAVCLNVGVACAIGDIIIFTDARRILNRRAVMHLVANFSDEEVGAVSGQCVFRRNAVGSDDTAVLSPCEPGKSESWQYETFVCGLESATGSIVGASDALYAIRKELFEPLDKTVILDEMVIPMSVAAQDRRIILEPKALAFEDSVPSVSEWERKVRMMAGNFQLLFELAKGARPISTPLAGRFFMHKVARLLVPCALVLMYGFSCYLALAHEILRGLFYLQSIFYAIACWGWWRVRSGKVNTFLDKPYRFCMLNVAVIIGLFRYLASCKTVLQHEQV